MPPLDLQEAWQDLLRRRKALAPSLVIYDGLWKAWATAPGTIGPLPWSVETCRERWTRGVPLLADAPVTVPPDTVAAVLGPLMELVAAIRADEAPALQRFAEAWDAGDVGPATLFPAKGRIGSVDRAVGLRSDTLAVLACGGLRPALAGVFADIHTYPIDSAWELGVCPFCGAPPGFSDIMEDAHRRLSCHVCGGTWTFGRLQCPFCGHSDSKNLVRLQPEDPREEGYLIEACRKCQGYVKSLDRRVRWNGGPAIVEDWGSPHLDIAARRAGYWRPLPTLLELAASAPGAD